MLARFPTWWGRAPCQGAHNNAIERGIRGLVVGRKNHYGSKSRRGTEVATLYDTIFETAKLAGIDPKAYLRRTVHAIKMGEPVRLPHEIAAAAPD